MKKPILKLIWTQIKLVARFIFDWAIWSMFLFGAISISYYLALEIYTSSVPIKTIWEWSPVAGVIIAMLITLKREA